MVDYAQRCHGAAYNSLRIYAVMCIAIYPVGINLLYAWLLYRFEAEIHNGRDATPLG